MHMYRLLLKIISIFYLLSIFVVAVMSFISKYILQQKWTNSIKLFFPHSANPNQQLKKKEKKRKLATKPSHQPCPSLVFTLCNFWRWNENIWRGKQCKPQNVKKFQTALDNEFSFYPLCMLQGMIMESQFWLYLFFY